MAMIAWWPGLRARAVRRSGVRLTRVLSVMWFATAVSCSSDEEAAATFTAIVIDADSTIRPQTARLHVQVESEDKPRADKEFPEPKWPQPFMMYPRGDDAKRRFTLVAKALDEAGEELGSVSLTTGFVAGQTRYARVLITSHKCESELNADDLLSRAPSEDDAPVDCSTPLPAAGNSADGGRGGKAGGQQGAGTGGVPTVLSNTAGGESSAGGGGHGGHGGRNAAGKGGAAGGGAGMSSPARMCGDAEVAGDEKCDTAISQGEQGACPTKCEATKPCTRAKLTGSECQARCEVTEIKEVVPGDGCCLANSDAVADSDCLSVCGNGVIEPGETCDPVASCATKVPCAASDACEPMRLSVDANKCTAKCEPAPAITACKDGDQCCPKGQDCTHATDSDCMPSCGDGVVDTSVGETCEPGSATPCPSCDDGNDCTTDVRTGSATTCNVKCAHAAITEAVAGDHCCPSGANNNTDSDCVADCGNGVVEADERCDGNCPASDAECDDHMACTIDRLTGTGCQRRCTYDPRAPMLVTKDECCPTDASAATDADCVMPTGNLVAGRTFTTPTANSTETQSFPVGPESITDGKLGTRWISALESMVTLTVDLGATYTLTRIRIVWAGNTTKKFSLRIASRSGQPGTEFYAGSTSGVMTEDIEYTPPSFVPPTGRYFQIYCADRHRNDYGNSIWEVEVYGTPAVPP